MEEIKSMNGISTQRVRVSLLTLAGSILVYWLFWNSSSLLASWHLSDWSIAKYVVRWMMAFIPMAVVLFLIHKPKDIPGSLGLDKPLLRGMGWALVFTSPLFIGFSIIGVFNSEITVTQIVSKALLAALFEELVFRGFMFGQLFRYGRIGFFWCALLPAVLFGLLHIYQGHDLITSLMAFGVTLIGAFYFSWIYVEWNFNLWVPVGLHMFMNLSWLLFLVEGTDGAAGGLISNILRVASILLAVSCTVIYRRRMLHLCLYGR